MKVGYVRVSTAEQNTARQEELMERLGVDKVYIDKVSGKNTDRPELQKMMNFVRTGDMVIVESISRFARNTKDLLELVEKLNQKNVQFISQKESIDTKTSAGKFMLTVFGAIAELERGYILERQREGIEVAKEQGKYKGRPAKKLENTKDLLELVEKLNQKNVQFISQKESIDTKTSAGKFMLTVFGAIAELERGYILERQREGIEVAKEQGKYKGRPAKKLDNFDEVYWEWYDKKITATEACRRLGISRSTFYRKVNEWNEEKLEF